MRVLRLSQLFVAGALIAAGCATPGSRSSSFGAPTITLRVVNQSGTRISISAIWAGGQPVYVGEVQNRRERSFTVPHTHAAHLQALVEFADGGRVVSRRLGVDPGETAELRLGVNRAPEIRLVDTENRV